MIPQVYSIERRLEEFPGTVTLHLRPAQTSAPPPFAPGQFNMLYAFGAGEVAISLSGAPTGQGYVHTIRSMGLTTRALNRLHEGDQLGVRGPFGGGWPLSKLNGKKLLVIAGGLGLAPLRPAIYSLRSGAWGLAEMRLFYGARSPRELLYREELQAWQREFEVQVSVDTAGREWTGRVGVITLPLAAAAVEPERTVAFVCGPEIMMRFCIQELLKKGMSEGDIYLSMERNMKCAIGHCGHCQWGPSFICREGPVFCYRDIQPWFQVRAL